MSYYAYIQNQNAQTKLEKNTDTHYKTNWHIIPNQKFGQLMHPKDWEFMMTKMSRFRPVYQKISLGHSVPLASIAGINNTSGEIVAFNNTLPILIYHDTKYHTNQTTNSQFIKSLEGETFDGSTHEATMLQTFQVHKSLWDQGWKFEPLVDAQNVRVLYPGNNGCELEWHIQEGDKNKYWINHQNIGNWQRKVEDMSMNVITPSEKITSWKDDPTISREDQLRFTHGALKWTKGVIFRNPPYNVLLKLEPIIAPSTSKRIIHYCKIFITINTTWEYLPFSFNTPSSTIPKFMYNMKKTNGWDGLIIQPLQNSLAEEDDEDSSEKIGVNGNFITPKGDKLRDISYSVDPVTTLDITQTQVTYDQIKDPITKKIKLTPITEGTTKTITVNDDLEDHIHKNYN